MFSLIVSTVGRQEEFERLLESLVNQTYKKFEVIIVDQNESLVDGIVTYFSKQLDLNHQKVSPRNASEARNTGLKFAKYPIVTFPDDDCWYSENVLNDVFCFFSNDASLELLTCKSTNSTQTLSHTKFKKQAGKITKLNSALCGIEFTIFIKKYLILNLNGFDEKIGPGSSFGYGAGEAHDFLLRAVENKCNSLYTPSIVVFHEVPLSNNMDQSNDNKKKLYSYAKGFGFVLRKNHLPTWYMLYFLLRPLMGAFLGLLKGNLLKCKYYFIVLNGRFAGWNSKIE